MVVAGQNLAPQTHAFHFHVVFFRNGAHGGFCLSGDNFLKLCLITNELYLIFWLVYSFFFF